MKTGVTMTATGQAPPTEKESQSVQTWTPSADAAPITAHIRISANGRIVIPAAMRERLDLKANDSVVLILEGSEIKLITYEENIRRIQQYFKQFAKPGVLWSDELIAERREEARREQAEADAYLAGQAGKIA
jgi:AbrB family looped-hinge helix DNA binding protein